LAKAPALPADLSEKLVSWEDVLKEIRKLEESGDWKTPGWKPQTIGTWVSHLMAEVQHAAKRKELKLPVDFDKVKLPTDPPRPGLARAQDNLLVVKDGKFSSLRHSIVLADGSVEALIAENCLIIARGAVSLSSSRTNVIVSGQFVGVAHDLSVPPVRAFVGNVPVPAAPAAPPPGAVSVIFSAGILDMEAAYGTICCGLERVTVTRASQGAVVLNSPQRDFGQTSRFEAIDAPQVPFTRAAGKNPLEGKLDITQVVPGSLVPDMIPGQGATEGHLIVRRGVVEYVVRPGAAVTDERGQPLAGLENWTLSFLGRNYALFSNGRQYAGFSVKR
jgi:hypothetical protein